LLNIIFFCLHIHGLYLMWFNCALPFPFPHLGHQASWSVSGCRGSHTAGAEFKFWLPWKFFPVFLTSSSQMPGHNLKLSHRHFCILSDSLFINHLIIWTMWYCTVWAMDSISK
jgi:hypothetical protein